MLACNGDGNEDNFKTKHLLNVLSSILISLKLIQQDKQMKTANYLVMLTRYVM